MKNPVQQQMPAARREGLLVRELNDEMLVYDLHWHKAHCLNSTAALIWKYCDGQSSESDIARIIEREQKTAVHPEVVRFGLLQLRRTHLLEKQITQTPGDAELSRRDLIKRLGAAAAVALPLVTSVLAPTAVEAGTCIPAGGSCTIDTQCCNKLCVGPTPGHCT